MNKIRQGLILTVLLLLGTAVIGRLFFVQVIKHDYYLAMAKGQQKFFSSVSGERGEIFFENGDKLATNQIQKFVYIAPLEIKDKEQTAAMLSQILNLKKDAIEKELSQETFYEVLKTGLTIKEVERIEQLAASLPGVYLGQEEVRFFPQGETASQTIGFVDSDKVGQYGLESYYQDILAGKEGIYEGEKGAKGFLLSFSTPEKPENGSNLVLTIDRQIQYESEKLLSQYQETLKFKSGTIIVVKPQTGEIVALANWPSFDPNTYEKEKDMAVFQNPATQKLFEPGSVFKPITMAAALEEKKITPQTTYIDEGVVYIGKIPIYNYDNRKYGERTMTEVLERSINTGAVFAEQQLGSNLFLEYLEKFKLFEKTGIDLQSEAFSQNKEFKKGYEINFATASFGQGIEITPIQLVRAFCAIANGGKLVKPYLVKEIIDENGQKQKIVPEFSESIISSETSYKVASMMTNVIENGFSKKAKIPGYFIAGKTGTAQVAWSALDINKSGYSDETVQSFIGFAPAFNPKFLILVKLDNPQVSTAEYSAMPIFRDLAEYIIDSWQIPPDYQP
ncbi:MAG: penicillin-binding protein 2 [bacterium]|nr:penicillin-binding protein 2 [bacterium]